MKCRAGVAVMGRGMLVGVSTGLLLAAGVARAQVDLSGNWQPNQPIVQETGNGPPPGDFLGVPLSTAGRAMAATADSSDESEEVNRQCQVWLVDYYIDGPFGLEIRPISDPLDGNNIQGWHIEGTADRPPLTIWVDGRAAPSPLAVHTWAGFGTGVWRGDTLDVSITHLKDGWMLRNAASQSDRATVHMFLTREADLLEMTFIVRDPVYLAAPYARARSFRLSEVSPTDIIPTVNDCLPAEVVPGLSDGTHAARYLPGQNPNFAPLLKEYGMPTQVVLGGPQEMYPEYQKALRTQYKKPSGYCRVDCGAAR
jgi:hypothetical protein